MTEDDIWGELDAYFCTAERQPGDLSIDDIARRYGISRYTAAANAQKAVDDGKLIKVEVIHNGRRMVVYRHI